MKFNKSNKNSTSPPTPPTPPSSPPSSPNSIPPIRPMESAEFSGFSAGELDEMNAESKTTKVAEVAEVTEVTSNVGTEGREADQVADTEAPFPALSTSVIDNLRPQLVIDAQEVARRAVETELAKQADAARFDVYPGNRVTITVDDEDLRTYRAAWDEHNSKLEANSRITFSSYLAIRLKACRTHTASRPLYVRDQVRQVIEDLFGELVVSDTDLSNKIDRYIRPIIESPDGELRLKPVDPTLLEMVSGWEPDKSPAEALGDFMSDAAMQKAGLM